MAHGDPALSAGLHSLTPQPARLIGMTREWSTNRAVRSLGLWGGRFPTRPNGCPPGRGRAPVVAKVAAWYSGMNSGLGNHTPFVF